MRQGITRRDFLRYSAAALGSFWLSSILPPGRAYARGTTQEAAYGTPTLQPQFTSLSNPSVLGVPADVAIGPDGATWVIGDSGAPSLYDPVAETWSPYGGGIDAAAYIAYRDDNGNYLVAPGYFRGGEVFMAGQPAAEAISARWPGPPALPPSFQGGVDGAANFANTGTVLFRFGQAAFVLAGGNFGEMRSLASFSGGWPGGAWAGGNFDYVISGQWAEGEPDYVYFVLGSEYLTVELFTTTVMGPPAPLATFYQGAALALLLQPGNQAVLVGGAIQDPAASLLIFRGPAVYSLANAGGAAPPQVTYLAQQDAHWPAAWHPVLQQAPAGRLGSLWGLAGGIPLFGDGTGWSPVPLPNGVPAAALDVGIDGAVFALGGSALYSLDASGSSWTAAATTSLTLQDLSVASSSYIWARDGQGAVYRFDAGGGTFAPVNLGVAASDIKANVDGTLWHCNAGQGSVFRYLSGGSQLSESICVGQGVTGVLRASSSSFGTGLFLAQQNGLPALIRYESPYVFKTADAYFTGAFPTIAVGAASIFLTQPATTNYYRVVALDAETGVERWSYTYFDPSDGALSPLYDANHHLVYAFNTEGVIYALDALTGLLVWTVSLTPVLPVAPVLSGGLLLCSGTDSPIEFPNSQNVYVVAIDTLAAVQAAAAGQAVAPRWQFVIPSSGQTPEPTSPVASNGAVYCAVWSQAGIPVLDILRVTAATGAGVQVYGDLDIFGTAYNQESEIAPLMAAIKMPSGQILSTLVVAAPNGLSAFQLDGSGNYVQYTTGLGSDNLIWTDLQYYDGVIYFGDSRGIVHAVDNTFAAVPGAPYSFLDGDIASALAVAPDATGAAILIAAYGMAQLALYFTATGVSATLATNQTAIGAMSAVTSEGMLYVGGGQSTSTSNLGQIFAIRTNDLSDLRDFVVESQMMQDYDPGAVSVARYQTHVTVVDDTKIARPLVDVKLWADTTLNVTVAGQPYTIGPDAPLATQADAAGTLTIVSDATDLFVTPLRLWASFMDPNERIVIYPDQEFHARLPNMTADPDNTDPTTINLATGTNYAGSPVFTNQGQAQAVASAVQKAGSSLGLGTSPAAGFAVASGTGAGGMPYIAYPDLPGAVYFPANTPATRRPVTQGTLGLSLNLNGGDEFQVMGFADAAAAIDNLQGVVDPQFLGGRLGNWFHRLWDDIKSGAAVVSQIVVAIADGIYIGLTYLVDGVKHVVREVVNDIEDVVALVGAFFIELGKQIQDVIELLSLLLHFDEIIATYRLLKPTLLSQINSLTTVIPGQLQPAITAFFQNIEQTISDDFCTLKKQVDPSVTCGSALRTSTAAQAPASSPAVSTFDGIGATSHTVFTTGPKAGGPTSSHAVHATWGMHKVKDHYQQATLPAQLPGDDPITAFFSGFVASLTSNSDLQQSFASVQHDFAATFQVRSSSQFLQMAIVDLLDIVQLLVVDSLAIVEALLNGLLAQAQAVVNFLVEANSGLLTQPLDIPIISDLFKLLIDDDLTFFNLMVLVASIPISILYRVIEGAWPADQFAGSPGGLAGPPLSLVLARVFGLLEMVCYAANAIFAPAADMFVAEDETPPVLSIILVALSVGAVIPSSYNITDHTEGVNLAGQIIQVLVGALGDQEQFKVYAPALLMVCALVIMVTDVVEKANGDADWAAFSGDFLSEIPTFVRPLQYLAQEFPFTIPRSWLLLTWASTSLPRWRTSSVSCRIGTMLPAFPLTSRLPRSLPAACRARPICRLSTRVHDRKVPPHMRKIKIVSRKYDGRLRDEHEAFVYAESEECLVAYAPPGTLEYDHRKQLWSAAPDGLLEFYFKTRWYTVLQICEQNSCINQSYTHISMPAVANAGGIEWVDLDLDYRVHLDGRIELLDEDEYAERSVTMSYPPAVHAQVRAACAEVEALYQARAYPFNHDEQLALYARIKAGQA